MFQFFLDFPPNIFSAFVTGMFPFMIELSNIVFALACRCEAKVARQSYKCLRFNVRFRGTRVFVPRTFPLASAESSTIRFFLSLDLFLLSHYITRITTTTFSSGILVVTITVLPKDPLLALVSCSHIACLLCHLSLQLRFGSPDPTHASSKTLHSNFSPTLLPTSRLERRQRRPWAGSSL